MSLADHLARLAPESTRALFMAFEVIEAASVPHVLVGGWAVYAFGSRVPSIDTDIYLDRDGAALFRAGLQARGAAAMEGSGRHIELLALDERNELHGFDWELEDVPAYRPSEILAGRTREVSIIVDAHALKATVPRPDILAWMKLKAFHDRVYDYRAVTDFGAMARINPSDRPLVARYTPIHYLRKAGKDLFDIAHLIADRHALSDILGLVPSLQVHPSGALQDVPPPIHAYSLAMAQDDVRLDRWFRDHTSTA